MSGNADDPQNDEGEWRIIVEKRRSIWERVTGQGKVLVGDGLIALIEQILSDEPTIRNIRRE